MHLTRQEERVFEGESGWAQQISMKILVRLGELFGADKLIPIDSAHVSGVSYKTLSDAPIEFLRSLAESHVKVAVNTTLNPQSLDPSYLPQKLEVKLVNKQWQILKCFDEMGISESLTCTPYYLGKAAEGVHLAWAESSAVVYANSILNQHTNREGGPSALAAAITGKTPNYGIHKPENREAQIRVDVKKLMSSEVDYGVLGACLGKILGDKIPILRGLRGASADQLKQLGAAMASTGMTSLFQRETASPQRKGTCAEKIEIEAPIMAKTAEELSTAPNSEPDLVFVGCPHCSLNEVKMLAQRLEGKKVKRGKEFWVCTSRCVKNLAPEEVRTIEKSGAHVLCDVCTVVSWPEKLGVKTIMTNSAKTAYYAPTLNKVGTALAPLDACVATATGQ